MLDVRNLHATVADKPILNGVSLLACAMTLLISATPAAAQLDAEGTGIMNDLTDCVQKYALEKDDGIKSPKTIADQTMASCEEKSVAFEDYAVRHSVKMTDQLRSDLRGANHKEAVAFVLLNRKAGRVHARN